MKHLDVIIIGAGAAGMMCAIEAGKRGRTVCIIDHARTIGEKIRISGGGRCNFTNLHCTHGSFVSGNPHFSKSALKSYTQHDFIALVEKHGIAYHEKTLGQLFCDGKSTQIIEMLKSECDAAGVRILAGETVSDVSRVDDFILDTSVGKLSCQSLVIATGGKSIPKIGATGFGYQIASQFGLNIIETRPGLVPFTYNQDMLTELKALSGISVNATVTCNGTQFTEGLLFTHRGISGPSILQISSYWREGDGIKIDLAPGEDILQFLKEAREAHPRQDVQSQLSLKLPKRLAAYICRKNSGRLADLSNTVLERIASDVKKWVVRPGGTEGYRTAEVTLGGVDTAELSSKTMEVKKVPGLYFIGEVVDVTGHLGGFNFQWAWSSGYAAGQFV